MHNNDSHKIPPNQCTCVNTLWDTMPRKLQAGASTQLDEAILFRKASSLRLQTSGDWKPSRPPSVSNFGVLITVTVRKCTYFKLVQLLLPGTGTC